MYICAYGSKFILICSCMLIFIFRSMLANVCSSFVFVLVNMDLQINLNIGSSMSIDMNAKKCK